MNHGQSGARLPGAIVDPLGPSEMLGCRGGGDHEDPWLWLVMGPRDPSQPPAFPPPEPPG